MIKRYFALTFCLIFIGFTASEAKALTYTICKTPKQSVACNVGLEKLRQIKNPLTGKNYFDDDFHYVDGEVFAYPDYDVATTDLDNDGFNEIIVKVSEGDVEMLGALCKENRQCPHFVLQDRNIPGKKSSLRNVRAMGPVFGYALGLSTDERVGGYKSLKIYNSTDGRDFDVYQYDRKSDNYFNIELN